MPVSKSFPIWVLLGAAGVSLAATTYRWVDAEGVHYSDQPHPGAEKVALSQPQTYLATPAAAPAPARAAAPQRGPFRYEGCSIVQPAEDEVLFDPEAVSLRAQTTPAVRAGDQVTMTLDGEPVGAGSAAQLDYRLPAPERGTHTVALVIRDPKGQSLCQSSPVTFHVRQPSQLAPQNPNNPIRKH